MGDYAHDYTDKQIEELEIAITRLYKEATDDVRQTMSDFVADIATRATEQKKLVESGQITQEQYNQWLNNQISRGENYESLVDMLTERYTNANETAMAYVNDATPGVYSLSRSYSSYTIEQYSDGVAFNLWDESTVRRLVVQNPSLMPSYPEKKAIDRAIDLAYGRKIISNSITKGILTGASIDKIAEEIMASLQKMNRNSAIRAARTAMTSAENGGRQDSYYEASKMGLRLVKVWLATLDNKTRPSHREADGQTVPTNTAFVVDGEYLMFPGDASQASAGNIYNCRCTMYAKPPDVDMSDAQRWSIDPETGEVEMVDNMSYNDWLAQKQKESIINNAGRILSQQEAIDKIKELYDSGVYDGCQIGPEYRAATNKALGYDAKPEVLSSSEFSSQSSGKKIIYRGVRDSDDVTAEDIVKQTKYGSLWTGNSGGALYGNGMYFSGDISVTDQYSGKGWANDGAVMTGYLKSEAKIVDYNEIEDEIFSAATKIYEATQNAPLANLGNDEGQYAALKGYDAIRVSIDEDPRDIFVILNRGMLVMEE